MLSSKSDIVCNGNKVSACYFGIKPKKVME